MREKYSPPVFTRVASVEDLTLASGAGGLLDVCIQIGGGTINVAGGVLDGNACGSGSS